MGPDAFKNKTALITGGTRGPERAIAIRLVFEGCNAALNHVSRTEDTDQAVHEIESGGGRAIAIAADVSSPDDTKTCVTKTREAFGPIDILMHCAEAWAPYNVRLNCISPGLFITEMAETVAPEILEKMVAATPMQRYGRPEEIAAVARFMVSEESSFMTGQTLVSSGGRVMLPG
jgi:NAD(P)-dependent dehydrogenase (short-subunit alcohol dehydrogenase family)